MRIAAVLLIHALANTWVTRLQASNSFIATELKKENSLVC